MSIGLLGKKLGMTQTYDPYGRRQAVTALQVGPCTVVGVREEAKHGYQAIAVGFEPVAEKKLNKAQLGQFKKAGTAAFKHVREFRFGKGTRQSAAEKAEYKPGQELTVEFFQEFELVDVSGISIGKGFQGGMKRWHWSGGNETHGSMSHRRPGSIGSTTTPGRVWRGHHLPGHMGLDRATIQNLRIVGIQKESNLLLLQGVVPGPDGGLVEIKKSVKRPDALRRPQELAAIIEDDENLSKTAKAASKKPRTVKAAAA